jgi:retinol-binding protein 3
MPRHRSVVLLLCSVLSAMCISQPLARAQQQNGLADRAYRIGVLQKIDSLLENKYVIVEKAKGYADDFRKRYVAGAYDSVLDARAFGERATADLQAITHDKHNTIRVIEPSDVGEKAESNLHHPVRYYRMRMKEHTGFTKLEWIEGRIGYLELRRFNLLPEAKDLLGVAMKFLTGASAIIIDIRENGGGAGDYLSSYFLPHPTQLTGAYYREGNDLQESWTSRTIEGERMLDVPLFILTSRKTFSAAESFAYDMKVRKRATLVGDTTKGGAHDVGYFKINDQFEMYLSIGRGINPVTHTNWEGIGVIPDVVVPASAALDTAIALAGKAAETYGRRKEDQLKRGVERMELLLARAEQLYRKNDTALAKAALDSLFGIAGTLDLVTEFFVNVLAYNYFSDGNEALLFALLTKSTELFPRSSTAFESLASTYYDLGKTDLALRSYRKVVELDPDNTNAQKRLTALTKTR